MSVSMLRGVDDWGLLGVAERHSELAELYSRYVQEMIRLEHLVITSDIRKENRTKRLLDLKKRLIPGVENKLQR